MQTIRDLAKRIYWRLVSLPRRSRARRFVSPDYWESRYRTGGDSGVGSYGKFALFKADVINNFISENAVRSVIEFGCGDGNQLTLMRYPRYLGLDVSPTAIERCRRHFASDPSKSFELLADYAGETADLSLSLDVIYHLVEDEIFEQHMRQLFVAASRFVVIYASDTDDNPEDLGRHIRHRKFSNWIRANAPSWRLLTKIANIYPYQGDEREGSFADFQIYIRSDGQDG